jgi:hypothetical protein
LPDHDPATHPFAKKMDARIKSAHDEYRFRQKQNGSGDRALIDVIPGRATHEPGIQPQAQRPWLDSGSGLRPPRNDATQVDHVMDLDRYGLGSI